MHVSDESPEDSAAADQLELDQTAREQYQREKEAIDFLVKVGGIIAKNDVLCYHVAVALGMTMPEVQSRVHWAEDTLED